MRRSARSIWAGRIMAEPLLALDRIRAGYGDAVVLDDIAFELGEGGSLALLGRNGVGKTTLLLTIMGFTRISRGTIAWRGQDITSLAPHGRARDGLGWVAQEREIFPSLNVEENLTVAARAGRWSLDAVYNLFPRLKERRASAGNHLSGGEQQMLAIARALMTNPALLLLDEPLEGLAPIIVEELTTAIRRMTSDEGTAFILVEQHAGVALSLTEEAVVLERGSIVHRARSQDLLQDQVTLDRLIGLRLDEAGSPSTTASGISARGTA
jgi:branched-chain amino acid transport system ATP-binding protein